MIEPTRALGRLVEQVIRPMYGRLCAIIKAIGGSRVSLAQVERSAKSVVGQCLFYKHCGAVLEHLEGRLPDEKDLDALVDHIVAFSLRGIHGLSSARKKGGGR